MKDSKQNCARVRAAPTVKCTGAYISCGMCGGGWPAGAEVPLVWSFSSRFLPFLSLFAVWGLGLEFYVFVVKRRHAFRREWPFITAIINLVLRHTQDPG